MLLHTRCLPAPQVIGCGALLAVGLQQVCFGFAGQRLSTRIRIALLSSLLKQEVSTEGARLYRTPGSV